MAYRGWLPRCVICRKAVELTDSKTDEYGQAVHEECYASMLTSTYKPFVPAGFELAISLLLAGASPL